jgi:hypothetical protein
MRHNLFRTEDYLFVIGGNYKSDVFPYLVIEKLTTGKYMEWQVDNSNDWDENNQYQILAHLPLNNAKYLDGIPVLPSLEVNDFEYKLRRTPMFEIQNEFGEDVMYNLGVFIKGYNKAREKYKFTEEDLLDFANWCRIHDSKHPNEVWLICQLLTKYQSLQQPKYPVAFECEMEEKFNCNRQIWTCGCLTESQCKHKERIVKSKTFINSEDRTEWLGKYIYE